jgi:hypothetical protein
MRRRPRIWSQSRIALLQNGSRISETGQPSVAWLWSAEHCRRNSPETGKMRLQTLFTLALTCVIVMLAGTYAWLAVRMLTLPNRIESYRTWIALMGALLAADAVVLDVVDYLRERLNVIVGVYGTALRAISGYLIRRCGMVEACSPIALGDAMKNWAYCEVWIAHR